MSCKNLINMRKEIKNLFQDIENYTLNSVYDETLRGQLGRWRTINISKKVNHLRPKKLYSKLQTKNKKVKKHIFFLPNVLDYLCPENIADKDYHEPISNLEDFFAILCKNKDICLRKEHIIVLYLTWEKIGRWRSIEKQELIEEIYMDTVLEKGHISHLLNELWKGGFLLDFLGYYGIKNKIKI